MSKPNPEKYAVSTHKALLKRVKEMHLTGWGLASLLWSMRNEGLKASPDVPLLHLYASNWVEYTEKVLGISVQWATRMERLWELFYKGEFEGKWDSKYRLSTTKMDLLGRLSDEKNIGKNVELAFKNKTTTEELQFAVSELRKKLASPESRMRLIAIHMTQSEASDLVPRWAAFKVKSGLNTNAEVLALLLKKAKA